MKILVGVTGTAETLKLPQLIDMLYSIPAVDQVAVVATEKAHRFLNAEQIENAGNSHGKNGVKIWRDEDEWNMANGNKESSDSGVYADLAKWADALIVAPLDANTMAELAYGVSDNLLTALLRNWDLGGIRAKPVFLCPSLNQQMWEQPVTAEQLQILEDFGFIIIPPLGTMQALGEFKADMGEMAAMDRIVTIFENYVSNMPEIVEETSAAISKGESRKSSDFINEQLLRSFLEKKIAKLKLELRRRLKKSVNKNLMSASQVKKRPIPPAPPVADRKITPPPGKNKIITTVPPAIKPKSEPFVLPVIIVSESEPENISPIENSPTLTRTSSTVDIQASSLIKSTGIEDIAAKSIKTVDENKRVSKSVSLPPRSVKKDVTKSKLSSITAPARNDQNAPRNQILNQSNDKHVKSLPETSKQNPSHREPPIGNDLFVSPNRSNHRSFLCRAKFKVDDKSRFR